jgi:IMP dehydrogenase
MFKLTDDPQYCFDDILLVPQHSDVQSRRDVSLKMNIGNGSMLGLPIIAAPMDTVCEKDMALEMAKNSGLGIIHRFMPFKQQLKMVSKSALTNSGYYAVGAAIGAKGNVEEETYKLICAGATVILVDTANGHSDYAIDAVKRVKHVAGGLVHIMAGNVSTANGFINLAAAGANSVRVGIGGGSVCTTRVVSGHGMPTLASVMAVKDAKTRLGLDVGIIADGGIRSTGDMVKAFAGGADAVMLGSMLAGTDESPGSVEIDSSGKYKSFRGMASKEANEGKDIAIAEGVATRVPYKGKVSDVLNTIRGGLGSGCSYSGVSSLKDLHDDAMFIEVSAMSMNESKPHALRNGI